MKIFSWISNWIKLLTFRPSAFEEEWHEAIANDPMWQLEEMEEEEPELADFIWRLNWVKTVVIRRFQEEGIYLTDDIVEQAIIAETKFPFKAEGILFTYIRDAESLAFFGSTDW